MSKKLQNIKAVKEMIAGTHKFQTKKQLDFLMLNKKQRKINVEKLEMFGKKKLVILFIE